MKINLMSGLLKKFSGFTIATLMCFLIVFFVAQSFAEVKFPANGQYQVFDKNGKLIMEWNFKNGVKDGTQKLFSPYSVQTASIEYNEGTIVKQNLFTKIAVSNFLTSAAMMLQDQGKLEEAIEVYREAINVRLENEDASYYLAELYVKLDEKDKAIKQLEAYLNNIKSTKEYKSKSKDAGSKCHALLQKLKEDSQ
jgi:tetratricopeptide (TPR) repeat protein